MAAPSMNLSYPSVLLAEDDLLQRTSIIRFLASYGYPLAGEAANGRDAYEMALKLRPGILLFDVMMPEVDGLTAARRVLEHMDVPVVLITGWASGARLQEAMAMGVSAFLTKPVAPDQLFSALEIARSLHARKRADAEKIASLSAAVEQSQQQQPDLSRYNLTPRETEVFSKMAEGLSNAEIAAIYALSERTVEKHVEHILQKLNVKSRTAAVYIATHGKPPTGASLAGV